MAIIPFPSRLRDGYARKIAVQLSKARSNREANHLLSRAVDTLIRQMRAIGISEQQIDRERVSYVFLIFMHCREIGSEWGPDISKLKRHFSLTGEAK